MAEYGWIDAGNGRQVFRRLPDAAPDRRSDLPCPHIMSDQIEVRSMVDGKTYTSKAALRQSYRAGGYVEVGNEEMKAPPKPAPDRKGISEAVGKAFARVGISV